MESEHLDFRVTKHYCLNQICSCYVGELLRWSFRTIANVHAMLASSCIELAHLQITADAHAMLASVRIELAHLQITASALAMLAS